MRKKIHVTIEVDISVDETKFTDPFINEFRQKFYPLDYLNDHICNLSEQYALGYISPSDSIIEGYGKPENFGIKFHSKDVENVEIQGE